jgi:hypothetical protein
LVKYLQNPQTGELKIDLFPVIELDLRENHSHTDVWKKQKIYFDHSENDVTRCNTSAYIANLYNGGRLPGDGSSV